MAELSRFRRILLKSPFLRKLLTWWYRHTNSTWFFGDARCVNIDALYQKFQGDEADLWTEASGWGPIVLAKSKTILVKAPSLSFAGRRVALFAHWDKSNHIATYVRYYAHHLRELGFEVVLTSGSAIMPTEEEAEPFAAMVRRDCPGYDFTSWKAALEILPGLTDAEEIFFTNDSIFAPVGDFRPIFEGMRDVPCDVWGLVHCCVCTPHLQSYGMVCRSKALRHPSLKEFFQHVPLSDSRDIALKHEQRFSLWLYKHSLSIGAWLPATSLPWPWFNPLHRTWKQMLKLGLPLAKRDILTRHTQAVAGTWKKTMTSYGYPTELIENYMETTIKRHKSSPLNTASAHKV